MAGVLILVGSQSGNASLVADLAAERLQELGLASRFADPQRDTPSSLPRPLPCSSVAPPTARAMCQIPFAPSTHSCLAATIDLGHVRYGVIALGDRTYAETFCGEAAGSTRRWRRKAPSESEAAWRSMLPGHPSPTSLP
ncbi:flavodoxin domain-containing protein [Cupriavidus basilensis]